MNWKCRVAEELKTLDENRSRLDHRLQQPQGVISDKQWVLMQQQAEVMATYAMILQERLVEAKGG